MGIAVFEGIHRRGTVSEAILQAFDLLELNGEDHRPLPLGRRKNRLIRLSAKVPPGISLPSTPTLTAPPCRHACAMGLEGIVSKRLSSPYRSGPCMDWIKVKNPDGPAMIPHREGRWEK
jgi:bifunctional non-homologous end joining protein LigD